jgi:molybdopterin-containing oxidoreductase family molybdopterin binding subunit
MDNIADYTLEKAEAICDVPAATIERLALAYATEGPVYTMTFQGLGHHVNSRHNYKDLALLHALTGNAGKSGASICGAPSCGMYSVNYTPMMLGSAGPSLCGMWLPRLMEDKQWAGTDIDLQVLWMHNGNMLSCESGRQELIEAVKKVPYVVHVGDMLNDSSEWADIVLPIPHSFEIEDFDCVCSAPYPTYYAKVIDPLYDCKSDLSIMRLVTEKMGVDLYPMTDEEFLHAIIDTDANLAAGGGYDDFKAGTFVWNYNYTEASQIKQYGSAESSRLKFYLENPYPRNNWGQDVADYERYPYYEHANEAYDENPLIEKYPLMGCSQHDKYHVHSQLAHTPVMREIDPEPVLKINAADAAERGIEQGDYVRAYNDHGSVVIKALVTEGIRPGVVSIPHGWQAGQFVEGHAQDLTNVFMNDFDANSAFYDFLCEVERCEGGAA